MLTRNMDSHINAPGVYIYALNNLTELEDCKVINDFGVCKLIHYFSNKACNSLWGKRESLCVGD